jgi:ectoine hydroxylase-related dioxygenase (phytanoyl-CoA dioxygenase family)
MNTFDNIYYPDAYTEQDTTWGEDRVILSEDTNLLEYTNFNQDGHAIYKMTTPYNKFLQNMVESKIEELTSRRIDLKKYHSHISDEEHTKIINAMPWKKTESQEILAFANYMEQTVSEILERRVKIFNDDIWVRICRPSSVTDTDYNPCHRDVYLDFYRNIANIYVPIVGSNELSSLAMQSGSHYWNERDIVVTKGGAFFPKTGKKYSVDAVLRSKKPLNMVRPNPGEDEFILFSPYLIHGCSSNENPDITRMSVEIRFIEDTETGRKQELKFREFLARRVWR